METMEAQEFVFFRQNAGDPKNAVAFRYSEKEIRPLIAASVRNVERALKMLKLGKEVKTTYATYRALPKKLAMNV